MQITRALVLAICLTGAGGPKALAGPDINEVVAALMSLCVGRGTMESLEAQGKGEVALALKNIRNLGGGANVDLRYTRQDFIGLQGGISTAMSQVQADQADKVRECTKPYIDGIVKAMLSAK